MRHGNIFSRVCLCVSLVRTLTFVCIKNYFWYAGTSSEYLGQGRVSRSWGQRRGHTHMVIHVAYNQMFRSTEDRDIMDLSNNASANDLE